MKSEQSLTSSFLSLSQRFISETLIDRMPCSRWADTRIQSSTPFGTLYNTAKLTQVNVFIQYTHSCTGRNVDETIQHKNRDRMLILCRIIDLIARAWYNHPIDKRNKGEICIACRNYGHRSPSTRSRSSKIKVPGELRWKRVSKSSLPTRVPKEQWISFSKATICIYIYIYLFLKNLFRKTSYTTCNTSYHFYKITSRRSW